MAAIKNNNVNVLFSYLLHCLAGFEKISYAYEWLWLSN